jgi:hypothetical protein
MTEAGEGGVTVAGADNQVLSEPQAMPLEILSDQDALNAKAISDTILTQITANYLPGIKSLLGVLDQNFAHLRPHVFEQLTTDCAKKLGDLAKNGSISELQKLIQGIASTEAPELIGSGAIQAKISEAPRKLELSIVEALRREMETAHADIKLALHPHFGEPRSYDTFDQNIQTRIRESLEEFQRRLLPPADLDIYWVSTLQRHQKKHLNCLMN